MEKIFHAFEISSTTIKLVSGYNYLGEVVILSALTSEGNFLLPNGLPKIDDSLIHTIRQLVSSAEKDLKEASLESIIVVLPSLGFESHEDKGTTNILSPENIVAEIDINNALSLIAKSAYGNSKVLVDTIPNIYLIDDSIPSKEKPLNKRGSSLSIMGYNHVIDSRCLSSYVELFRTANLKIEGYILAASGLTNLLNHFKDTPTDYLLLDFGGNFTTISYVYDRILQDSVVLQMGSNDLSKLISSKFNLDFKEANRLKEVYGLSKNPPFDFEPVPSHSLSELSDIIKDGLLTLVSELQKVLGSFAECQKFPLIITGSGASLNGFEEFLKDSLHMNVMVFEPTSFGARAKTFANCLGAIYYAGMKYPKKASVPFAGLSRVHMATETKTDTIDVEKL